MKIPELQQEILRLKKEQDVCILAHSYQTRDITEIADFTAFNEVYARYFTSKPARSCVAVKDLPKGALCEIECIAEA